MGIFDGFAQGLASAIDDIRHQVVEQPMYGQQTTGNIELPQVEAPATTAPGSGVVDLTPESTSPSWGVSSAAIEPPVEPVSWQQAAQGIESPQIDPPAPQQDMGIDR